MANICKIRNCTKVSIGRHMCSKHYDRWYSNFKKTNDCLCGCGEKVRFKFKPGHANRMLSPTELVDGKISLEHLKSVLSYDRKTGIFKNKSIRSQSTKVGHVAGSLTPKGYVKIKIKGRGYAAHQLAIFYVTGVWPEQVDHKNGVKDDNRYANLRVADSHINAQNKKFAMKGSASGLLGAHRGGWKKRRWVSAITTEGETLYLGIYKTAEEAHEVYKKAKRKLHKGCTI